MCSKKFKYNIIIVEKQGGHTIVMFILLINVNVLICNYVYSILLKEKKKNYVYSINVNVLRKQ